MKSHDVGKIFEAKMRAYLADLGTSAGPYGNMMMSMGNLVSDITRRGMAGEDVSADVAHLNAMTANLSSAIQAVTVRETQEMLEESMREALALLVGVIRLA